MINANELRIGNWIYDDEGHLSKINGMKPFEHSIRCDEEEGCELLFDYIHPVHGLMEGCGCDSNECNPIPLTPEILEKCGFEKDYTGYKHTSQFSIYITKDGYFMPAWMDRAVWPYPLFDKKMEYLHQLQNLYFDLTNGNELTYQLQRSSN